MKTNRMSQIPVQVNPINPRYNQLPPLHQLPDHQYQELLRLLTQMLLDYRRSQEEPDDHQS